MSRHIVVLSRTSGQPNPKPIIIVVINGMEWVKSSSSHLVDRSQVESKISIIRLKQVLFLVGCMFRPVVDCHSNSSGSGELSPISRNSKSTPSINDGDDDSDNSKTTTGLRNLQNFYIRISVIDGGFSDR